MNSVRNAVVRTEDDTLMRFYYNDKLYTYNDYKNLLKTYIPTVHEKDLGSNVDPNLDIDSCIDSLSARLVPMTFDEPKQSLIYTLGDKIREYLASCSNDIEKYKLAVENLTNIEHMYYYKTIPIICEHEYMSNIGNDISAYSVNGCCKFCGDEIEKIDIDFGLQGIIASGDIALAEALKASESKNAQNSKGNKNVKGNVFNTKKICVKNINDNHFIFDKEQFDKFNNMLRTVTTRFNLIKSPIRLLDFNYELTAKEIAKYITFNYSTITTSPIDKDNVTYFKQKVALRDAKQLPKQLKDIWSVFYPFSLNDDNTFGLIVQKVVLQFFTKLSGFSGSSGSVDYEYFTYMIVNELKRLSKYDNSQPNRVVTKAKNVINDGKLSTYINNLNLKYKLTTKSVNDKSVVTEREYIDTGKTSYCKKYFNFIAYDSNNLIHLKNKYYYGKKIVEDDSMSTTTSSKSDDDSGDTYDGSDEQLGQGEASLDDGISQMFEESIFESD